MKILSISKAHPENYYTQEVLLSEFKKVWAQKHHNPSRVERLHKAVSVGGRYLALKREEYYEIENFTQSNDHFIRVATEVGEKAIRAALNKANLNASDVDALFFVSVTGVSTPSIDARMMNRLPFRKDTKRIPIFGLGCVAGAAGLARVHDYLRAYPDQVAILLSVELCSLTLQREDLSIANLISSGLFGDGGACIVAVGDERAKTISSSEERPSVYATQSRFYPDTEDVMGWSIGEKGFRVILQARVPQLARDFIRGDVDEFLAAHQLTRADIKWWVCHTGGPKVIDAFRDALEIPEEAVSLTRKSLRSVGNLSSASVLFVLADTIRERPTQKGDLGLLMAMGPGFCCEMVLLRW
ncbi:MAG: 3-oxoacyl-[acyl-carrier-protein] synthase III C-terminal domain-containing protein [Myxococcota bacterium]|nr:3-oxoacyl-[acyl-carrier-protein] synthase III C-terminal domain-containing protein [Myxococcota bacterium]